MNIVEKFFSIFTKGKSLTLGDTVNTPAGRGVVIGGSIYIRLIDPQGTMGYKVRAHGGAYTCNLKEIQN